MCMIGGTQTRKNRKGAFNICRNDVKKSIQYSADLSKYKSHLQEITFVEKINIKHIRTSIIEWKLINKRQGPRNIRLSLEKVF